jgi:hypothetical protein
MNRLEICQKVTRKSRRDEKKNIRFYERSKEEKKEGKKEQKALEKGIIIRKTSFYICEDFPDGKFHGKQLVTSSCLKS